MTLPADFPADFPIPPDATITHASTRPDAEGMYASATLVARQGAEETTEWYRNALAEAGWSVMPPPEGGTPGLVHAEQGESYVDLAVIPRSVGAEAPSSEARIELWKTAR